MGFLIKKRLALIVYNMSFQCDFVILRSSFENVYLYSLN